MKPETKKTREGELAGRYSETPSFDHLPTLDTSLQMIRRELGIWRRLEHPNIVPFLGITYGFGRQGNASIVSLWMANGTLGSFVGEHDDRLTIVHRLKLVRGCNELLYAIFTPPLRSYWTLQMDCTIVRWY